MDKLSDMVLGSHMPLCAIGTGSSDSSFPINPVGVPEDGELASTRELGDFAFCFPLAIM